MNNQQLFQIVQAAGGMHLLYNNDIEQVRAIAQAAFEAGKQAVGAQDVLDMSDSRNWQVGDVVRSNGSIIAYTVAAIYDGGLLIEGCDMAWIHEEASRSFTWLRHATKETAK